jgi:hypothetical protein
LLIIYARRRFESLTQPLESNYLYIFRQDTKRANWLGYVLLFASAVDYFLIIYPPQLTNPEWELQPISRMVDHAWVGLIAVILVFLSFFRWAVLWG